METEVKLYRALVRTRNTEEEWRPVPMHGLEFYSTYNEISRMVLESCHWLPQLEFKIEEADLNDNS